MNDPAIILALGKSLDEVLMTPQNMEYFFKCSSHNCNNAFAVSGYINGNKYLLCEKHVMEICKVCGGKYRFKTDFVCPYH